MSDNDNNEQQEDQQVDTQSEEKNNSKTDDAKTDNQDYSLEEQLTWYQKKKKDADDEAVKLKGRLKEKDAEKSEALKMLEEESAKAQEAISKLKATSSSLSNIEQEKKKLALENQRLRVGMRLGLSDEAVEFLQGETPEEIEASAKKALKVFGGAKVDFDSLNGGLNPTKNRVVANPGQSEIDKHFRR